MSPDPKALWQSPGFLLSAQLGGFAVRVQTAHVTSIEPLTPDNRSHRQSKLLITAGPQKGDGRVLLHSVEAVHLARRRSSSMSRQPRRLRQILWSTMHHEDSHGEGPVQLFD